MVSERNGTWGKAIEVPGSGALNAGGFASVGSVWYALAGDCAAGGDYRDGHGHGLALVVNETNGIWGRARQVPGLGTLNKGGDAFVLSVSCASAGNCAAGGGYRDGSGHGQAFVVSQASMGGSCVRAAFNLPAGQLRHAQEAVRWIPVSGQGCRG